MTEYLIYARFYPNDLPARELLISAECFDAAEQERRLALAINYGWNHIRPAESSAFEPPVYCRQTMCSMA